MKYDLVRGFTGKTHIVEGDFLLKPSKRTLCNRVSDWFYRWPLKLVTIEAKMSTCKVCRHRFMNR